LFDTLGFSAEPLVELGRGPIADLPHTASDGHPLHRPYVVVVIVTAGERRVGPNGADLERAQSDLFRRCPGADGDHDGAFDTIGCSHAPLENPHAAHGTPHHCRPPTDAEMVRQQRFDPNLVTDGDDGKS
jgi:hypothetical protein